MADFDDPNKLFKEIIQEEFDLDEIEQHDPFLQERDQAMARLSDVGKMLVTEEAQAQDDQIV